MTDALNSQPRRDLLEMVLKEISDAVAKHPILSWTVESAAGGGKQHTYQLKVELDISSEFADL